MTIKQIVIRDIGRKENGVTIDVVTQVIVQSILKSALEAAPGQIPSIMFSAMKGGLGNLDHMDLGGVQIDLGKGLSDLLGKIGNTTDSGGSTIDDTIKGIGKGIGDLINGTGGKDKDKDKDAEKSE